MLSEESQAKTRVYNVWDHLHKITENVKDSFTETMTKPVDADVDTEADTGTEAATEEISKEPEEIVHHKDKNRK